MADNKIIFISDVHLGMGTPEEEKQKEIKLVTFLYEKLNSGDRLFIVGDLFDFWFEYKNVIPKGHMRILSCLSELVDNGVRIDYFAGNHDFWVGEFFRKELGLVFHADPVTEKIDDKTFYIIHGDGLRKNDVGYRVLKKVFRNRLNIFLYRWLHPDIGVPFARWCSGTSRKHTFKENYGTDEDYIKFAEAKVNDGVDYVVMGHTHCPLIHEFKNNKKLINPGDWISNYSYIIYKENQFTLGKV